MMTPEHALTKVVTGWSTAVGAAGPRGLTAPCFAVALAAGCRDREDLPEGCTLIEVEDVSALAAPMPTFPVTKARMARLLPADPEGVVPLRCPVRFPNGAALAEAVRCNLPGLRRLLVPLSGCVECRLTVWQPACAVAQAPGSQTQARIAARLASALTALSVTACITPPALRNAPSGEVRMALSLVLPSAVLAEARAIVQYSAGLARSHGLGLHISEPLAMESFPLASWCLSHRARVCA